MPTAAPRPGSRRPARSRPWSSTIGGASPRTSRAQRGTHLIEELLEFDARRGLPRAQRPQGACVTHGETRLCALHPRGARLGVARDLKLTLREAGEHCVPGAVAAYEVNPLLAGAKRRAAVHLDTHVAHLAAELNEGQKVRATALQPLRHGHLHLGDDVPV